MTDAPINLRVQAKAATLAKVKDAAAFLFANKGYFDVGLRDVAKRMGMSLGAVTSNAPSKEDLWRLAMGGSAPDVRLAEEVALLEAQRPGWRWSLRTNGATYIADVADGNALVTHDVVSATGRGPTPAEAVRHARIQIERKLPPPRRRRTPEASS
ncbi:TetR/AcrR family transcriptional regulator [uncultured Brevundimonas sp.]|uniref:TetR/AcrR family transcriptional regulator n=1 Tax=uncultured Brevundimonas sp. TaxID=213418 RepID=UPI0025D08BA6|nr:TetR/AcrR family transcriptional regulator [uncultured Brevundimonas sp.]